MSRKIVIFGATSAMAMESAKIWATRKSELCLIARSKEKLEVLKKDLITRGALKVSILTSDLSEIQKHQEILSKVYTDLPELDTVLIAYGTLSDQKKCQKSSEETLSELTINFLSVISLVTNLANHFEKRGQGDIAVITSVAGDRGRQSNYVYGTAKGGLSIFLQGLRNRFGKTKINIIDIRPGFTDTPMTADIQKGPLFVSAAVVGKGIVEAIDKKKEIVYLPWFWRFIMLIIRSIPESIFKKMSL